MDPVDTERWIFTAVVTLPLAWLLYRLGVLRWPEFDPFRLTAFTGTPEEVAFTRANNTHAFADFDEFRQFLRTNYPDMSEAKIADLRAWWRGEVLQCPAGESPVLVVTPRHVAAVTPTT